MFDFFVQHLTYVGPVSMSLVPVSVFFLIRLNLRRS